MKMKRLLSLTVSMVMLSGVLFGCGEAKQADSGTTAGKPADDGKMTFGVICQALNSEYWHGFAQGAREGAEEAGVEVIINGPIDETKVTEQIAMIEEAMTNGVDALLVAANQAESILPTFELAKKKGIPVMEVDVEVSWDGRVCYVGAGNYNGGVEAGKWFLDHLPEGSEIAVVRGAMGDPTHDLRANGCLDTMGDQMKVVSIQPADSLRDKAVNVMENILTANPDIKGVFCTNDEMALGALKAIETRGLDIKVIGFDGNMEALVSVKEDGLAATVSCVGYDIAKLAVTTMKDVFDGKQTLSSSDQVFVPPTCVDKTQVDKFIEDGEVLAEKIKN